MKIDYFVRSKYPGVIDNMSMISPKMFGEFKSFSKFHILMLILY